MKKILLTITVLLTASAVSQAQSSNRIVPSRFEISLATGVFPIGDYASNATWGCYDHYWDASLKELYSDNTYKTILYVPLCAQFFYNHNSRISFGGTVGWNLIHEKKYDPYEEREHDQWGAMIHAMPEIRLYIISHEKFRMYAAAGLGLAVKAYRGDSYCYPDIEVVPIGFTLGRKIYWNLEYGLGDYYIGLRTGVGYRF